MIRRRINNIALVLAASVLLLGCPDTTPAGGSDAGRDSNGNTGPGICGPCRDDSECQLGMVCAASDVLACPEVLQQQRGCANSGECSATETCMSEWVNYRTCQRKCETDLDCPTNTCLNGACVIDYCKQDRGCAPGTCEPSRFSNCAARCTDDSTCAAIYHSAYVCER